MKNIRFRHILQAFVLVDFVLTLATFIIVMSQL